MTWNGGGYSQQVAICIRKVKSFWCWVVISTMELSYVCLFFTVPMSVICVYYVSCWIVVYRRTGYFVQIDMKIQLFLSNPCRFSHTKKRELLCLLVFFYSIKEAYMKNHPKRTNANIVRIVPTLLPKSKNMRNEYIQGNFWNIGARFVRNALCIRISWKITKRSVRFKHKYKLYIY